MSYKSKWTKILDSELWYNMIADQYGKYHKHLDSFFDFDLSRFIDKGVEALNVADLWAWDGRVLKYFKKIKFQKYVACDIADKLLEKHPEQWWKVQKVVCDLNENLPFEDSSFNVATSFFVLEHIENIDWLFGEVYRILSNGGKWIIGHFPQRREFEWQSGKWKNLEKFKIQQYTHKLDWLKKIAEYNFFDFKYQEIVENNTLIGYLIICTKQ